MKAGEITESQPVVIRSVRESLPPIPSSRLSKVTAAFIYRLDVTDPRYNILHYGAFIRLIPQRLGRNKALDAAVNAAAICFPAVYTTEPSPEAYRSFASALKTLRVSVEDPATVRMVETLCAMYLVMVMQVRRPSCSILMGADLNGLDRAGWGEKVMQWVSTEKPSHTCFKSQPSSLGRALSSPVCS